jgi:hypothetical protein
MMPIEYEDEAINEEDEAVQLPSPELPAAVSIHSQPIREATSHMKSKLKLVPSHPAVRHIIFAFLSSMIYDLLQCEACVTSCIKHVMDNTARCKSCERKHIKCSLVPPKKMEASSSPMQTSTSRAVPPPHDDEASASRPKSPSLFSNRANKLRQRSQYFTLPHQFQVDSQGFPEIPRTPVGMVGMTYHSCPFLGVPRDSQGFQVEW